MSVPLFDGGACAAQVRAQQAALEQAHAGYQAAVLTALKDVEDALVALRGDRERLARLQQAAEAAGNAALLARQRYSSGLVDFQTVLETQRTQLSTQDSVASAGADLSADHVRLYKALGGGWQPGSAPTPRRSPRCRIQFPDGPLMNSPTPAATPRLHRREPAAGAGDRPTSPPCSDEPASHAWYRRPALWVAVALLAAGRRRRCGTGRRARPPTRRPATPRSRWRAAT